MLSKTRNIFILFFLIYVSLHSSSCFIALTRIFSTTFYRRNINYRHLFIFLNLRRKMLPFSLSIILTSGFVKRLLKKNQIDKAPSISHLQESQMGIEFFSIIFCIYLMTIFFIIFNLFI